MSKLNIPTQLLPHSLHIHAIEGGSIRSGTITHCTQPLLLQVSVLHQECISFLVTITAKHQMILWFPWMQLHDSHISWADKEIIQWSSHCFTHCLQVLHLILESTTVESTNSDTPLKIPTIYQDLQEIFSKTKASGLPPHHF